MMARIHIVSAILLVSTTILAAYSAYKITDGFIHRQKVTDDRVNDLCKGKSGPSYCYFKKAPQFTKFLWFVTDGLSVDYSQELFEFYGDHAVAYGLDVPGAKYSHAIYSSWLSGQGTYTNYKGNPIIGDTLLERMTDAGFSLKYVGPEWSFLAVVGKDNYDKLYDEIETHHEALDGSVEHSYPFFFENSTAFYEFEWEFLPELVYNNQSLIAHSGVFDHINHGVFRYKGDEKRLTLAAKVACNDLKTLRRFIDENPEYLLILSSDHGVDAYANGGYVLHGFTEGGNEGYMLFYNPLLEPSRVGMIDVVDVAATVAKYLKNVDIPFNSVGMARNYFGEDSLSDFARMMQQNLRQLYQGTLARSRPLVVAAETVKELLQLKFKNRDPTDAEVGALVEAVMSLKSALYDQMDAPFVSSVATTVALVTVFAFIFISLSARPLLQLLMRGKLLHLFGYSLLLMVIYFAPLSSLLFSLDTWKGVFRKGSIFFLPSTFLSTVITVMIQRITQRQLGDADDSQSQAALRNLSKIGFSIATCMLLHEAINWVILSLSLTLGSTWKGAFSFFEYSSVITYLTAAIFVLVYFGLQPVMAAAADFSATLPDSSSGLVSPPRLSIIRYIASLVNGRFVAVSCVLALFWVYECTESEEWWYGVGGFHHAIVAAAVLGLGFWLWHIVSNRTLQGILVSSNLLLFVLWLDSTTGRMLHLLFNFQLALCLGPALEFIFYFWKAQVNATRTSRAKASLNGTLNQMESSIVLQAGIITFINSVFYHLSVNMGDAVTLDVHPFAGRVGVRSYDEYPTLAGFCMIYHKYCIFLAWLMFAIIITVKRNSISFRLASMSPLTSDVVVDLVVRVRRGKLPSPRLESGLSVSSLLQSPAFLFGVMLTLFCAAAAEGHHLLLYFYTPDHALEESMIFNIAWSSILGTYCSFQVIERLINRVDEDEMAVVEGKED